MAQTIDDEEKEQPTEQPSPTVQTMRAGGGGTQQQPQIARSFQTQPGPGGTPGQQTPMPWGGLMQGMQGGQAGAGATPWAQQMQTQQMPQRGALGGDDQRGQGQPNWAALQARFAPPQQQGAPAPAGGAPVAAPAEGAPPGAAPNWAALQQRFGAAPMQQGPRAFAPPQGGPGGGWLQNAIAQAAQRIGGGRGRR